MKHLFEPEVSARRQVLPGRRRAGARKSVIAAFTVRMFLLLVATCAVSTPSLAQRDPGVRGGYANTAGAMQQRGIAIAHPPVIGPHPVTGARITANELASFLEGVRRAGQLESTCDNCASVVDGTPVTGQGELDPVFPQFHTNSNGLGARHNGSGRHGSVLQFLQFALQLLPILWALLRIFRALHARIESQDVLAQIGLHAGEFVLFEFIH